MTCYHVEIMNRNYCNNIPQKSFFMKKVELTPYQNDRFNLYFDRSNIELFDLMYSISEYSQILHSVGYVL